MKFSIMLASVLGICVQKVVVTTVFQYYVFVVYI
jgi:hypothetical protein